MAKLPKNAKNVKKIPIRWVDSDITTQKGLFGEGCLGADCDDICCEYGCDADLASIKLILKHRDLIEPLIKAKIEDCFATELVVDDDYIGGAFRETAVRDSDERCAFHMVGRKGCSLFYLWQMNGLPKRILPTICRSYPITWHRGRLFVDRPLRRLCKCMEKAPKGAKVPTLYDTQKKEIKSLFEIKGKSSAKTLDAADRSGRSDKSKAEAKAKRSAKSTPSKAARKPMRA